MEYKYTVAKVKPLEGRPYITVVKLIPIQKISRDIERECSFEECSKMTMQCSGYCYDHWYDVMYNQSKVRYKDGKIYSLRKKRKTKEKKNAGKSRNENGKSNKKRKDRKRRKGPQDALGFDLF